MKRTVNARALISSLQVVTNPRQSHAAKEVAFTHLTAQFRATLPKELASTKVSQQPPGVEDLISALGVVADPAALPSNKAKAIEKLTAYFKSLSQSAGDAPSELTSAIEKLTDRVARAEKIAASHANLRTLLARSEQIELAEPNGVIAMIERAERNTVRASSGTRVEKTSAVRPRGTTTIRKGSAQRFPTTPQEDGVIGMINRAESNTLRGMRK